MDEFEIILKQTKSRKLFEEWDLKEYFSKLEMVKWEKGTVAQRWPCSWMHICADLRRSLRLLCWCTANRLSVKEARNESRDSERES